MLIELPNGDWIDPTSVLCVNITRDYGHISIDDIFTAIVLTPKIWVVVKSVKGNIEHLSKIYAKEFSEATATRDGIITLINNALSKEAD